MELDLNSVSPLNTAIKASGHIKGYMSRETDPIKSKLSISTCCHGNR